MDFDNQELNHQEPNHLNPKDQTKLQKADLEGKVSDSVPSVNAAAQDTASSKKLKNLAVFVGVILVAIAGIVMAASRYSENKEQRQAQEAQRLADEQKKLADGQAVNIAADQQNIQNSKMYDIPPPADATDLTADVSVPPPAEPVVEPYVPPPTPIPNSQYDNTVAYRDYSPPAPMPVPAYEPSVAVPSQLSAPEPSSSVQAPAPAGVLVDVYGTKAVTASTTNQQANQNSGAKRRGDKNLLLIKGTTIPCVLKTKIDSTYQGAAICQVSKDVYGANGKTLLIERGSTVFGEQNVELKQGQARVAIIWQTLETPSGISITLSSPATGQLGEMGVDSRVNTHFFKRFGNAILLSLIQDAIAHGTTHLEKTKEDKSTTITNTTKTTQSMAEKALENSINIPPTAIIHQGTLINIMVAYDVDFGGIYKVEGVL